MLVRYCGFHSDIDLDRVYGYNCQLTTGNVNMLKNLLTFTFGLRNPYMFI